jgi:hypothetical protein
MTKLLPAVCAWLCLLQPAWAWNAEGHMVVAQIAYKHLDSEVKAKCDVLIAVTLPNKSASTSNFVTAACWADDFKSSLGSGIWHYIDLPFSLDGTSTNGVDPGTTNVVWAINQSIATLRNPNSTQTDQATALRYLIHFVGDVEQPLHSSTAVFASRPTGDDGGNGFYLNGDWSNLHSLWDAGGGYLKDSVSRPLDTSGKLILSNKVAAIETAYPYTNSIGAIPNPMDWAVEGCGLAKTVCYVGIVNNGTPSAAYTNTAQATTRQRMAIGGQRLAKLLGSIFVTNSPSLNALTVSNGTYRFSWSAVTNRSYRVQWKSQLNAATWNDLTDVTATNNAVTFSDPATQTQRYYRVVVVN